VQAALGVGDHRHLDRVDDGARLLGKLGQRQRAGVGQAVAARRGGVAADIDAIEAVRGDQLCRERVGGAERDQRLAARDRLLQFFAMGGNNYDPGPELKTPPQRGFSSHGERFHIP
jgi:hypothetical protein